VKLLLSESFPFSGGERMGVVLNNVGAVDLPKHRQKNSVNLKRLLFIVKVNARLRNRHVTKDDKDVKSVFREHV
jgi:hypothetical protein